MAYRTSAAGESIASFRLIRARCVSTVFTLMCNERPASLLVLPWARSLRISRSRGVSGPPGLAAGGRTPVGRRVSSAISVPLFGPRACANFTPRRAAFFPGPRPKVILELCNSSSFSRNSVMSVAVLTYPIKLPSASRSSTVCPSAQTMLPSERTYRNWTRKGTPTRQQRSHSAWMTGTSSGCTASFHPNPKADSTGRPVNALQRSLT